MQVLFHTKALSGHTSWTASSHVGVVIGELRNELGRSWRENSGTRVVQGSTAEGAVVRGRPKAADGGDSTFAGIDGTAMATRHVAAWWNVCYCAHK